jgi:hypothetical protein
MSVGQAGTNKTYPTAKTPEASTNSFQLDPPLTLYQLLKSFDQQNNKQFRTFLVLLFENDWNPFVLENNNIIQTMTSTTKDDDPYLSPTSPGEGEDLPAAEIEPVPGLSGVPVRCTWHCTPNYSAFCGPQARNVFRSSLSTWPRIFIPFFLQQGMMYVAHFVQRTFYSIPGPHLSFLP